MGKRMALNLSKSDANLTVWNRSEGPRSELAKAGVQTAKHASEAAAHADLVISMLATPEAVEAVFLGPSGALSHLPKGATWIDCSTVNPAFSQRCEGLASHAGISVIDAPVAGTMQKTPSLLLLPVLLRKKLLHLSLISNRWGQPF